MLCYFCHIGFVFLWAIFLLVAIKLTKFDLEESKKYFSYALIFALFVGISGVKLIMLNPAILKGEGWLHTKISIALLVVIENVYFYFKTKELKEWIFYLNLVLFVGMLALVTLRPF